MGGDPAVHVLLVPDAGDVHRGRPERLGGQNLIERLSTPELIVSRVFRDLVEERQRVDAEAVREVAGRPAGEEQLVRMIGAPCAPFGMTMTVCSFTPSRMG